MMKMLHFFLFLLRPPSIGFCSHKIHSMGSEDNTCQSLSNCNTVDDVFAMELEIQLQQNDKDEDQDDKNGPDHKKRKLIPRYMVGSSCKAKSGASRQRKRQATNKLPKAIAKGKGKSTEERCRTSASDVGEPSEAFQQPAPKGTEKPVKELIKTKTVAGVLKVLGDRVYRKIKNDEMAEKESLIILMSVMMDHRAFSLFEPIARSLKTKSQWPMRSDLDDIKKKIRDMEVDTRKLDDEKKMDVLPELEKIEHAIKSLDVKREKYKEKVDELSVIFTTEGVGYGAETLRKKLSTVVNPRLFLEENATDKLPNANNHEEITAMEDSAKASTQIIFDTEGISFEALMEEWYDPTRTEFTVKDMEKLEKELFDHNCNVEFSNFSGLEGVKGAGGNIPDYLKPIAKKIEEDRGERTIDAHRNILVLVSAAIKEMEDLSVDELDWPILLKWAATFNLAKRLQFEVKFVEKLLKKNMHAYFSQRLISSLKVVTAWS